MSKNKEIDSINLGVAKQELAFKMTQQKLERLYKLDSIKEILRLIAGELVLINQKLASQ